MDFTIVTGANDKYIMTLLDFITSIHQIKCKHCLVVYDYGLSEENVKKVENLKLTMNFELKKIDFTLYPEYVNPNIYYGLNCSYAFKVVSIYKEACSKDGIILWCDCATRINDYSLQNIISIVNREMFYCPVCCEAGSIEALELHHPKCISIFNLQEEKANLPQRSSNVVCFDYRSPVGKMIMDKWYEYSLVQEAIIPEGSSRNNHRQDQSVLSCIMFLYEKHKSIKLESRIVPGIHFWQNKDNFKQIDLEKNQYKLIEKRTRQQRAIIMCDTLEEAIIIYSNRKYISKEDFLKNFIVSL